MNSNQSTDAHSRKAHLVKLAGASSYWEIVPTDGTNPLSTAQVPGLASDWERLAKEADYNSAKMASLCTMTERHLQRFFKKHTGFPPTHWLRRLQCRLAKDLISQGYSSKAAAAELKFAGGAHFCREFKKVFGASPQNFAPNRFRRLSLSGLVGNASSSKPSGYL